VIKKCLNELAKTQVVNFGDVPIIQRVKTRYKLEKWRKQTTNPI
jgi:hypothetical protein